MLATVNLGNYAMGLDPKTAIARYREALALIAVLRGESPANPRYTEWGARTTSNLGLILVGTGKIEDAVTAQRQAVALAEKVADEFLRLDALAMCRNNLAEALEKAQRLAEAETSFARHSRTTAPWRAVSPTTWTTDGALAMCPVQSRRRRCSSKTVPKTPADSSRSRDTIFDDLKKSLGTNAEFQKHHEIHTSIRDAIRRSPEPKGP